MACGCGGAGKARAMASVVKYEITDDPNGTQFITEREARQEKELKGLSGDVVPVQ